MANTQIGDLQKAPFIVTSPPDADGNPQPLATGETIVAVVSDPSSASVVFDATPVALPADALAGTVVVASGFIVGGRKLGTDITVEFDSDKEDGTVDVSTVVTIDVVGGTAKALSVSIGAPVAQ